MPDIGRNRQRHPGKGIVAAIMNSQTVDCRSSRLLQHKATLTSRVYLYIDIQQNSTAKF